MTDIERIDSSDDKDTIVITLKIARGNIERKKKKKKKPVPPNPFKKDKKDIQVVPSPSG